MSWWAWLGRKLGLVEPLPPASLPAPALLDRLGYDEWQLPLAEAQQAARQVWWLWHEHRIDAAGVRLVAEELRQRIDHQSLGDHGHETFAQVLKALRDLTLRPLSDSVDKPPSPACLGADDLDLPCYPPLAKDTEHYSNRPPQVD